MKKYLALAALFGALGINGCATDTTYAAARARAAVDDEPEILTGTRLPRPTTERILKRVGQQEYKEENIKSISGDAPPKVN